MRLVHDGQYNIIWAFSDDAKEQIQFQVGPIDDVFYETEFYLDSWPPYREQYQSLETGFEVGVYSIVDY